MKDLASITNSLQLDNQFWTIQGQDGCINKALAQLWGDEDVVQAFACSVDDSQAYVLFLTNKCRAIISYDSRSSLVYAHNLTDMDPNKVRFFEKTGSGWFSRSYYHVIIDGIGNHPITFVFGDKKKARIVHDAIVGMAKPKIKMGSNDSSDEGQSSGKAAAIAEIRSMYEAGIIDKAEMLDLIKSL